MSLTPRTFAAIVGALLLLGAIIALAMPITVNNGADTVKGGDAFKGVNQMVSMQASGQEIADAMYPEFADTGRKPLAEQCADAVGTRRTWGWPAAGVGAVVLLGLCWFGPRRDAKPRPDAVPGSRG